MNRTLNSSADVSSLVDEPIGERSRVHSLKQHRFRLLKTLSIVAVAIVILWFLLVQFIARPIVTQSSSDSLVGFSAGLYESVVQDYLNNHFFERNRMFLNTDSLLNYMWSQGYNEVSSIGKSIERSGFGGAKLQFSFRKPVVRWQMGTDTVYVDQYGDAFKRDYYASRLVEVSDQTGIAISGSQVLVSDRFLRFIGKTVGKFSEDNFEVDRVVLPPNTTRQVLVYLEGVGYPIKMTIDRPAAGQVEDAVRSVKFLSSEGISIVDYVDVRVSGKAFYR